MAFLALVSFDRRFVVLHVWHWMQARAVCASFDCMRYVHDFALDKRIPSSVTSSPALPLSATVRPGGTSITVTMMFYGPGSYGITGTHHCPLPRTVWWKFFDKYKVLVEVVGSAVVMTLSVCEPLTYSCTSAGACRQCCFNGGHPSINHPQFVQRTLVEIILLCRILTEASFRSVGNCLILTAVRWRNIVCLPAWLLRRQRRVSSFVDNDSILPDVELISSHHVM